MDRASLNNKRWPGIIGQLRRRRIARNVPSMEEGFLGVDLPILLCSVRVSFSAIDHKPIVLCVPEPFTQMAPSGAQVPVIPPPPLPYPSQGMPSNMFTPLNNVNGTTLMNFPSHVATDRRTQTPYPILGVRSVDTQSEPQPQFQQTTSQAQFRQGFQPSFEPQPQAQAQTQPQPQPQYQTQSRPQPQGQPPPPVQPQPPAQQQMPTGGNVNIARVLEPLPTANPAAFGPSGPGPLTPLANPLPTPPRDLYEMSPYKSILTLPQTTALLTASLGAPVQRSKSGLFGRKSGKGGGLFRSLSSRKHEQGPTVHYVPVYVDSQQRSTGVGFPVPASASAAGAPLAPGTTAGVSAAAPPPMPAPPAPILPVDPTVPAVRFNSSTTHSGFMNHSPHRVMRQNLTYPTATHLLEAMKYLPHRPDLAERIRACPDIHQVYPLSQSFQQHQRTDWSHVFLQVVRLNGPASWRFAFPIC